MRLAYLATHPIQYHAPLFRKLSEHLGADFVALFCHDHGVRPSYDVGFKKTIQFDVPLLDGYEHRFLRNISCRPGPSPLGKINPEIFRILASGEFDALILHGYAFATSVMCLWAPRFRTRLLFRGDSSLLAALPRAKRIVKNMVLPSWFRRVDHFLSVGQSNTKYYEAYGVGAERITVAPYSVDNDFFIERSQVARRDPAAARRRLGLPDREVLFVFAAKLLPKKRPFDLLEAFIASGIRDRAGLVYVGDGQLRTELEIRVRAARLNDAVAVLGFRNQTELPEILGACDVLVLPSDFEPWGLAVNEAMACGAAVIISNRVGAGPDLVNDPRCTFPAGDVDALEGAMREIVFNPGLLAELKTAASKRIAQWDIEATVTGVLGGVDLALKAKTSER